MSDEFDKEETGATTETVDGNAGVSDRSEREIEAGADGTDESRGEGEGDEILDALAEADPKRAVVGLKKRLAKLTAQRNEARRSAEESRALKAELDGYRRREREAKEAVEAARRNTPDAQKAEARRQAIREAVEDAYPGLGETYVESQTQAQLQREKHAQDGISYLRSELEDHGITADEATLVRWEKAVGSEIQDDADLLTAFRRPSTQKRAIEIAFSRIRDGITNPLLKQQGAKPLARIQRNRDAVLGGGTNRGTVAQTPEPIDYTEGAKGLKGRALDDYWAGVKQKEWARLAAADEQA